MLNFTALPDEIKALVIERLDPDDVIPFSLINRKVHALSKDRIQRHLELQEIFSEIHIDKDHHPLTLLYAIRKNPEIASYIKYVEWHGADDPLQGLPAGPLHYGQAKEVIPIGPWDPAEIRSFMPDIRPALNHAGAYVISWAMWRDRLSKGRVNACFLLLLFHLPKLVRLRFMTPTFDAEFYYRMFAAWSDSFDPRVDLSFDRHLVQNSPAFKIPGFPNHTYNYPHRMSPPSLQVVEACDDAADPNRLEFAPLTAFAALPSVRTLRVKDSAEAGRSNPLPWLKATPEAMVASFRAEATLAAAAVGDDSSDPGYESEEEAEATPATVPSPSTSLAPGLKTFNLRALEITDCSIPAVTFKHILPRCPNLTSFKMSFATSDPTDPSRWTDFASLFDLLHHLYGKTLTALSLVQPLEYGATAHVKSFKCFTALKWLEVSLATLIPHDTWREKEEYLMRSGGKVPRLIDIIPDALEDLILGIEIAPRALSKDRLLSGWPRTNELTIPSPLAIDDSKVPSPMSRLLGMRSAFDDFGFVPAITGPQPSSSSGNGSTENAGEWRFDRNKRSRPSESDIQPLQPLGLHSEWRTAWETQLHSPTGLSMRQRKDSCGSPPPPPVQQQQPTTHQSKRRRRQSTQAVQWPYAPNGKSPSLSSHSQSDIFSPDEIPASLIALPPTTKPSHPVPPTLQIAERRPLSRHSSTSTQTSSEAESPRPPGLPHELRRIIYFCCSTATDQCSCLDASTTQDFEEGVYIGLDIRRKRAQRWGPEHEVRWNGEVGWSEGSRSTEGSVFGGEGDSPIGEDVVLEEGDVDLQAVGREKRLERLGLAVR